MSASCCWLLLGHQLTVEIHHVWYFGNLNGHEAAVTSAAPVKMTSLFPLVRAPCTCRIRLTWPFTEDFLDRPFRTGLFQE